MMMFDPGFCFVFNNWFPHPRLPPGLDVSTRTHETGRTKPECPGAFATHWPAAWVEGCRCSKTRRITRPAASTFDLLYGPTDGMNGRARNSHEPFPLSGVSSNAGATPASRCPRRQGPGTQPAQPPARAAADTAPLGNIPRAAPDDVAEAIAALDAQFPWLQGAEKPISQM